MKKLLEVQDCKLANHLEVEVYYSLGGMNYFTGKNEGRGYYLSVSPVKIEGGVQNRYGFHRRKNIGQSSESQVRQSLQRSC